MMMSSKLAGQYGAGFLSRRELLAKSAAKLKISESALGILNLGSANRSLVDVQVTIAEIIEVLEALESEENRGQSTNLTDSASQ